MSNVNLRLPYLFAATLALPLACRACMSAEPLYAPGEPIRITDESALIVWDARSGEEQFVRRADFQTKAKGFGFLVPTPTKPKLAAANDGLFNDLEFELQPKTKFETQWKVNFTPFVVAASRVKNTVDANAAAANKAEDGAVEVVAQKRVGDYNATVLRASNTATLAAWLRAHKYAVTDDMRDWLAPYVRKGFYITAFQIVGDAHSQSAQAGAVRLSFKTPAPFYPYRESKRAQKVGGGRSLRLFFVGSTRVEGRIKNGAKSQPWSPPASYSAPLAEEKLRSRGLSIPSGVLRLTAFEDDSSPRPGWGDLRFSPSKEQAEITPPPIIVHEDKRFPLPLDVLALVGGCGLLVWRRRAGVRPKVA